MWKAVELSKTYNRTAPDALNLDLGAGEIYCLLRANGAGFCRVRSFFQALWFSAWIAEMI